MRRVATSWQIIDNVLKENANTVFKALRPPATDGAIAKINATIPGTLPRAFVQSLQVHDGIRDSRSGLHRIFDNMAMLTIAEIIATWRMEWDMQVECEFEGCPLTRTRKLKNDIRWRAKWVPFLDCEGDKLVIDLDPGPTGKLGQVFRWYNYGSRPRQVIADSFSHWLHQVADELHQRRFKLDEWGGICLTKWLT